MFSDQLAMDQVAENLANANSSGYRRSMVVRRSFAEVMLERGRGTAFAADGGGGVANSGSWRSFAQGELRATERPTDVGLDGDGFFLVRDQNDQPLLTRAGSFTFDDGGRLVTADGYSVQGQGGAIQLPDAARGMVVDEQGRVYAQLGATLAFVDQLRVVAVDEERLQELSPRSGQYFEPGSVPLVDADSTAVRQGQLEAANVDPVRELVSMIDLQRRYDAAQRSLSRQLQTDGLSDILRGV
jgi:flagellar basal-body rod protein FlgG